MKTVTDHLGREISFSFPPKKIVSFAPAITQTLYSLQLDDEIVGRTRFCKYPQDKVAKALNVGGTKDFKIDRIHSLKPDLIIMEKEENTEEMVKELEKHYPVYVFEIQSVDNAFRMITDLGTITDRNLQAESLSNGIRAMLDTLPRQFKGEKAAYVIWQCPYMVAGNRTYINSVLETLGFENPFTTYEGRYPTVTEKDFAQEHLDYIFLATEPFPFQESHVEQFKEQFPDAIVKRIDGEMFWYGAMMLDAVPYFTSFFKQEK